MTEKLMGVSPPSKEASRQPSVEELGTARELVRQARFAGCRADWATRSAQGVDQDRHRDRLDEEMSEHLGYDKHETVGPKRGNSRNGRRSQTLLTCNGGLTDVDEVVLSLLYVKGLTTGEISAHLADVYGASVSKDTVSRITDKVVEEMQARSNRPLERSMRRC
jgi:putative transposase